MARTENISLKEIEKLLNQQTAVILNATNGKNPIPDKKIDLLDKRIYLIEKKQINLKKK